MIDHSLDFTKYGYSKCLPTPLGGDGHISSYRLDRYPLASTNTPSTKKKKKKIEILMHNLNK